MKRAILLLAVLTALSLHTTAQEKGQWWIGGGVSFSSDKTDQTNNYDTKTSRVTIIPEIGYALSEHWAIGTGVGYTYNKTTSDRESDSYHYFSKGNLFTIAPFVRYSFLKGEIGYFFLEGTINYTFGKKDSSNNGKQDYSSISGSISPGIALNLSHRLTLLTRIGSLGYVYSDDGGNIRNYISGGFSLEYIALGLNYKF